MSGARTVLFGTAAQKPPYSAPEPQAFAAAAISFMVVSGNPGGIPDDWGIYFLACMMYQAAGQAIAIFYGFCYTQCKYICM